MRFANRADLEALKAHLLQVQRLGAEEQRISAATSARGAAILRGAG